MDIRNFIKQWEGGYACVEGDSGKETNSGITIATFRMYFGEDKTVEDLKNLTREQWEYIFKKGFWEKLKCDYIKDEKIRNFLVDWGWNSGTKAPAKAIQRLVGVKDDGVIGNITLAAINKANPTLLFYQLFNARQNYLEQIVRINPAKKKFLLGWENRIFDFLRESL